MGYRFANGSTISDLAEKLMTGEVSVDNLPPIRVYEHDGGLWTLDHRRLEAFRRAGLDVPYRMATPEEIQAEWWKRTTKTGGLTIRIRGEPQEE